MTVTRLSGGLTPADGSDPRTFPAIWNATANVIDAQADDIATLDAGVVSLGTSTGGTVAFDFTDGDVLISHLISGTAVTITGADYVGGSTRTVRLHGGTAVASLAVPNDWVFVGNAPGTAVGTATTVIVTATCFGTAASDGVAAFAEEA